MVLNELFADVSHEVASGLDGLVDSMLAEELTA